MSLESCSSRSASRSEWRSGRSRESHTARLIPCGESKLTLNSIFVSAALLGAAGAFGAELVMPTPALERTGLVSVVYRTAPRATGEGTLTVQWRDVHGRLVEDRKIPIVLTD